MMLPLAALLTLFFSQGEPTPEEVQADPRMQLPIRPDHGLSLDASAHGQGGAVAFEVQAAIDRRRLRVGEALTLTLTIHATGAVFKVPHMPNLAMHPHAAFAGFAIEPQPPIASPWWMMRTWTFVYKLRPRSVAIKEVPAILLMYWDPVVQSDAAFLSWPVVETNPLPLEVLPLQVLPVPLLIPPGVDHFAADSELFTQEHEWRPPGIAMLILIILFPPLLCILLYALWKLRYPDALTAARRQQTRAARTALRQLAAGRLLPPDQRAEHSSTAVASYLRSRLALAAAEPTPTEAALSLEQAGVPDPAIRQTAAFLRSCDAARFGRASSARLPEEGSALVLLLEAQTWAPSS